MLVPNLVSANFSKSSLVNDFAISGVIRRCNGLDAGLSVGAFFSKVRSTFISTYYRQSYPDFISEGDPPIELNKSFWTEIHSFESETLEQKQERVYRFIERAAQADAKQGKSTSSSCVIN